MINKISKNFNKSLIYNIQIMVIKIFKIIFKKKIINNKMNY